MTATCGATDQPSRLPVLPAVVPEPTRLPPAWKRRFGGQGQGQLPGPCIASPLHLRAAGPRGRSATRAWFSAKAAQERPASARKVLSRPDQARVLPQGSPVFKPAGSTPRSGACPIPAGPGLVPPCRRRLPDPDALSQLTPDREGALSETGGVGEYVTDGPIRSASTPPARGGPAGRSAYRAGGPGLANEALPAKG